MYVRSHIDTVSGDRKYIYIDENNKKYIKDKNKYYPIKKYKGSYTLQKIRGGVSGANINVKLHVYGIKSTDGTDGTEPQIFDATINMDNIVLDSDDHTYKEIIKDNKIYIFNKDSEQIKIIKNLISDKSNNNITHFIIHFIKDTTNTVKVYLKTYKDTYSFDIDKYKSFYNIIYIRNNKIDGNSENEKDDHFFVIFSINEYDVNININDEYKNIPKSYNEEYYVLYNATLNKLKYIYQ